MHKFNRFNLIDEQWIPTAGYGLASLKEIFLEKKYKSLGGSPVEKISLLKLLLAIAQASSTPENDEEWGINDTDILASRCITYLEKWHDRFWLYGERPFLQMPQVVNAEPKSCGAFLPEIATGNTSMVSEMQVETKLSDPQKAILILTLGSFGMGGKKADKNVILSEDYTKKASCQPGPSLGFLGFLHTFLTGASLLDTIRMNLVSNQQISQLKYFEGGIGMPPWEKMPVGEICQRAEELKKSYLGRLLPLSRFYLLGENNQIHVTEGIIHPGYLDKVYDPSITVNFCEKKPRALWVDPKKRPWRFLTAQLSFISATGGNKFECKHMEWGLTRARKYYGSIGIWSGGLRVSSNAGEQYVTGSDDFVESEVILSDRLLGEAAWYGYFKIEMEELEKLSKILYSSISNYYKDFSFIEKKRFEKSTELFWQLCEQKLDGLVKACQETSRLMHIRDEFSDYVKKVYDLNCPHETPRQFDSWGKNRPDLSKYLKTQKKD